MTQAAAAPTAAPTAGLIPDQWRGGYRQSALVLGAAQLGSPHAAAAAPIGPTVSLLRAAAELGVTHLDTARAYGSSEQRLGAALRALPARRFEVVSKVAPLVPPSAGLIGGADEVAAAVEASVARSRQELGVRRLTVLLHQAADARVADGAAWDRLRELRGRGVATRIGVTVRRPEELPGVLALPDLGYLQVPCNLLDQRWQAADVTDALLARPELVVTARSVFLQGLLAAGRAVRWPRLADIERDRVVGVLDGLAAQLGRSRDELCLSYVRAIPWVTSVVINAESADQLRQHAALVRRPALTAGEREWVRSALPTVPPDLLDPTRWRA